MGKGSFSVLMFGETVRVDAGSLHKFGQHFEEVKIQATGKEQGWTDASDLLFELPVDTYSVYIREDSIRLKREPTESAPFSAIVRNNLYGNGENTFILPVDIQLLDDANGWLRISVDSEEGWIKKERVVPAASLSLYQADGKEIRRVMTPESGVLHLWNNASALPLVVGSYRSISFHRPRDLACEKRFYLSFVRHVEGVDSSEYLLVDQCIPNPESHRSQTRLIAFDPSRLTARRIISRSGMDWPRSQFFSSPSGRYHYVVWRDAANPMQLPAETIVKLDSKFHPIDSLNNVGNISTEFGFVDDDTLLAIMVKRDQRHQDHVIGYIDASSMKLIAEENLTKYFNDEPRFLSFEKPIFRDRSMFVYGRYTLAGEQTPRWRFVRIDLGRHSVSDAGAIGELDWGYTPSAILDRTLIYPYHPGKGSYIRECDLDSVKLIKSIQLQSSNVPRLRERMPPHLLFIVGDEESGLYDDGILKSGDGSYIVLRSIHKD